MKKINGYSLVELSVVILILGLIFSLLYIYYPRTQIVETQKVISTSFDTENLDNAIVAFSYSHGRLPFPDTGVDGFEDIGATRGQIPYRNLGLAERPVNKFNIPIIYSIFSKPNTDAQLDADLGASKDRLYALLPTGIRTAGLTALDQRNTIDFCFALKTAANLTAVDTNTLYVSKPTPLPGYDKNVAYVLVDVGATDADNDGQLLDGLNRAGVNFEVATKAKAVDYDDQVNSKDFSELFGALACGSVISAALHAHDNAVLAADMMHTSFEDYSRLLDLAEDVADIGVLLATAAILQAVAGIADSTSAGLLAIAETIIPPPNISQPKGGAAIAILVAAAVLSVAATAAAALSKVTADDALVAVQNARSCFDSGTGPICTGTQTGLFVSKMAALRTQIRANAVAADREGL